MVFYKFWWWCPQVDNEYMDYKRNSNFKIVKVVKSTSKTTLNHLLLSITLMLNIEDLNLIVYIVKSI